MTRRYEVYINGALARKHLTLGGAKKTLAQYPNATGQIFKVVPTVEVILLVEQLKTKLV